jgi:acyl-CoA synthetase (AMP-forming)/AMP-acid ligase II
VPAAGGVLVAINTRLAAEEIRYILEHSGSRMLVVDPSLAPLVENAPVERVLVTGPGGDYEASLEGARDGGAADRLESEDDTISINYHKRHHRAPEGRDVHASGRLFERATVAGESVVRGFAQEWSAAEPSGARAAIPV